MTTTNTATLTANQADNDLAAMIAKLRAENEILKAQAKTKTATNRLTLKVSAKGALSIYGLGRFPVTLYSEQWTKLLGMAKEIQAFIEANQDKLAKKGDKVQEATF